MPTLTPLEPREATVAFDLVFAPDAWLADLSRRYAIASAFARWGAVVLDSYPPIARTDYVTFDHRGRVLDDSPAPLPADTIRVYVQADQPVVPGAIAEAGEAGYSAGGLPLDRPPAWVVTFDPTATTDALLPAVALHEAGHVVGLDHQPVGVAPEWRTVMHPYADPAKTHLTGLDYRDLLWSGHDIPSGTVISGIGTTPGGWMVYDPHGVGG